MNKRKFLGCVAATMAAPAVWAQKTDTFVIAINEGVTYRDPTGLGADRFAEVTSDLQKILKRPVRFHQVRRYPELVEGMKQSAYDLAYVHPTHHALRAVKRDGYHTLALTKGFTEYRAAFMVKKESPLKTLADLKGRKVGAPDEDSITSVIARATLHDNLPALPEMTYVRYQDAVPFMVENNLSVSGVSASKSVVKAWADGGGRILATCKPVPIKHMIASANVPSQQRDELAAYFLALEQTGEGKSHLKALNVAGFVGFEQAALTDIGKWLGV